MKTFSKILFLSILILTLSMSCFAVMTTLTIKGGVSRYQGDQDSDRDVYPMGGISFEVWFAKFLSIGIDPYYTYLASGETPHYSFETHAGGADVLLKLRPFEINLGEGEINKMAPFIVGGGGFVNYFPKQKGNHDLVGSFDYVLPDDSPKYNTAVFPTVGGGLTFMTQHNFNIDLGVQWDNTRSDWIDGAKGGDHKDSFAMLYLGLAFNFGMPKEEPVVETPPPAPAPEPTPPPVVETPPPPPPAPEPTPEPEPVPEVKPEVVLSLKPIYFDFDKYDLREESKDTLDELAEQMKAKPEAHIEIQGNCDIIGQEAYNDRLSVNRANAAKEYLMDKGITEDRLLIKGNGFHDPVDTNKTAEGRQHNRNCQFTEIQ